MNALYLGKSWGITFLSVILSIICVAVWQKQRMNEANKMQHRTTGDVACGPRCVSFVLQHYGLEVEFSEVANELLEIDASAGTSLAAIQQALQKRGIYTLALEMSSGRVLDWPHPVIVHLDNPQSRLGHFIVLTKTLNRGGNVEIWNGLSGLEEGSYSSLVDIMSGNILLTSQDSIGANGQHVKFPIRNLEWTDYLEMSSTLGVLILVAWLTATECKRRSSVVGRLQAS